MVPGAIAPLPIYFLLQHASFVTIAVAAGAFAGAWACWAHYAEWALEGRHRPNPFDPKWLP